MWNKEGEILIGRIIAVEHVRRNKEWWKNAKREIVLVFCVHEFFFLSGATRGSSNVMPIIHLFPTEIPFQNFCFVCGGLWDHSGTAQSCHLANDNSTESRKKWISKSVGVIQEVALMVPWRKSIRAETKNALFPSRWLHTRNSLFRLEFCFFYKKKKEKEKPSPQLLLYCFTTKQPSFFLFLYI